PGAGREITAAGVGELARSPRMARLTGLKLGGNRIGNEGAAALAGSPSASNLRELYVRGCGIDRAGLLRVLEAPHLAGLPFDLSQFSLAARDARELKARYKDRVK